MLPLPKNHTQKPTMQQLYLEKLYLTDFKNYEDGSFGFSPDVNCIVGENGSGKTNLLDAIYFLALSKSAFHNQDALSIRNEADFFIVDGTFQKQQKAVQITCSLQRGARKILMSDKKQYERISEHIGRFPVVMMAPDDTDVVREGSEERRRFFDGILSQLNQHYLQDLLQYNRILSQRNSLLKSFYDRNYFDADLLETYDEPFVVLAQQIFVKRRDFLTQFLPLVQHYYAFLGEGREQMEIIYESEVLDAGFGAEFRRNRQRDLQAQRTTLGIHKDDFTFEMNGFALRKFGSQGQQKSFVIALRLAQFELLSQEKEVKPILLLDDIFDKLDDRRIQKLLEMINGEHFGQVFLTDARPERTAQLLVDMKVEIRYFMTM
jgi:DNA replication and repair protein RecF